jgi:hypothetical protein
VPAWASVWVAGGRAGQLGYDVAIVSSLSSVKSSRCRQGTNNRAVKTRMAARDDQDGHSGPCERLRRRARAGGAVRRSETFIIPIASCLQGTILAPTPARFPTAGSVAHGHQTFWLSAAATFGRGEMSHRDEMVTTITCDSHPMSPAPPDERRGQAGSRLGRTQPSRRSRRSRRGRAGDGHSSHGAGGGPVPTVRA